MTSLDSTPLEVAPEIGTRPEVLDLFGPTVPAKGIMSARSKASIPEARNGSINVEEKKPRTLGEMGLAKRPRPPKAERPPPKVEVVVKEEKRLKIEKEDEPAPSSELLPIPAEEEKVVCVKEEAGFHSKEEDEDSGMNAAIELMMRQVEETVRPNRSEIPATFSLQEELNAAEAARMGRYSKEAEDDAEDQEIATEAYYSQECFPVRSVMGFITRGWRVPLKECELAFVVNGHWWRKTRFDSLEKLELFLRKNPPSRIEIGGIRGSTERYLVFDTDLEDLAPGQATPGYIRTCKCKGTRNMCSSGCWFYMVTAVKCLTYIVKNLFKAKHVFPVYSGRRGVHTWVLDEVFVKKTSEEREAIVARIQMLARPHEYSHPEYTPYILEYILSPAFDANFLCADNGLFTCQETVECMSRIVTDLVFGGDSSLFPGSDAQALIVCAICQFKEGDFRGAWNDLCASFGPMFRSRLLFWLLFPRIDVTVTTQMNHCIKLPFVIHPDTKRCSIPIPDIETWTPDRAPRLSHFIVPPSRIENKYGYRPPDAEDEEQDKYNKRAALSLYVRHMTNMVEAAYPFIRVEGGPYRP